MKALEIDANGEASLNQAVCMMRIEVWLEAGHPGVTNYVSSE